VKINASLLPWKKVAKIWAIAVILKISSWQKIMRPNWSPWTLAANKTGLSLLTSDWRTQCHVTGTLVSDRLKLFSIVGLIQVRWSDIFRVFPISRSKICLHRYYHGPY
jgi:hypothetical protein